MSVQSHYIDYKIESTLNSLDNIDYVLYNSGWINHMKEVKSLYKKINDLIYELPPYTKTHEYATKQYIKSLNVSIFSFSIRSFLSKLGFYFNSEETKEIRRLRKRISDIKKDIFLNIKNIKEVGFSIASSRFSVQLKSGYIHNTNGYAVSNIHTKTGKYFINDKELPYEKWIILSRKEKINKIIKRNEKSLEM